MRGDLAGVGFFSSFFVFFMLFPHFSSGKSYMYIRRLLSLWDHFGEKAGALKGPILNTHEYIFITRVIFE